MMLSVNLPFSRGCLQLTENGFLGFYFLVLGKEVDYIW